MRRDWSPNQTFNGGASNKKKENLLSREQAPDSFSLFDKILEKRPLPNVLCKDEKDDFQQVVDGLSLRDQNESVIKTVLNIWTLKWKRQYEEKRKNGKN
jgi:hypothetical protein